MLGDGAPLVVDSVLSQLDTHPGSGGVATHPITSQVIDHTREHGVAALRDCHVLQRVKKVWLQAEGCKKQREKNMRY